MPPAHPLSSGNLRGVRAMAEAVFSDGRSPPSAHLIDHVVSEFDQTIIHSGFRSRVIFGLALTAISLIAPLLIWRWPGLARLPIPDRVRAITRMEESPALSAPVLMVKAIICIAFYDHPDAQRAVGFIGTGFPAPPPGETPRLAS